MRPAAKVASIPAPARSTVAMSVDAQGRPFALRLQHQACRWKATTSVGNAIPLADRARELRAPATSAIQLGRRSPRRQTASIPPCAAPLSTGRSKQIKPDGSSERGPSHA